MASYTWPSVDRRRPEDIVEHATCLKADFDLVSNAANTSLFNTTLLPSGLESRISTGIKKGIAEACSNGYCPKWSETDKDNFSKAMLKSITTEVTLEIRDRIPLPQFHGLHGSYTALHTKLATRMPPTATTHQFVTAGTAMEATSVVDLVKTARKQSKEIDQGRNSKNMVTIQQEEKAADVSREESGKDTSEEQESGMDESWDAGDGQEIVESEDIENGDYSSEDGPRDDGSGSEVDSGEDSEQGNEEDSEEVSETDSDAGSEDEGTQEIVREKIVPKINEDGNGFSFTVNLKIEHQASVNQLEGMTAPEILDCISSSLKIFLGEQQLSSESVHISSSSLLDNGDVKVGVHAETLEASKQIIHSAGWDQGFERTLIESPVPTYKVRMHKVEINSLKFQSRKEKSAIIRKFAGANRAIGHLNGAKPVIRDIRWSQYSLPNVAAPLIVEFLDPEQATQALTISADYSDAPGVNVMVISSRSAPLPIDADNAPASIQQRPANRRKLTKERRSLGFLNENASQAIEPAAEAQAAPLTHVRHSISVARTQTETSMPSPVSLDANSPEDDIKSEPDHSLTQADPTRETYPDTATLLKQIEVLRKVVLARETAQQTKSSGRVKRRAEEAFACEAEAKSPNMAAKRIKQEQRTR
ncbi:MAG: hypothetical protein Q9161_001894 [Pseudevernia consocians]